MWAASGPEGEGIVPEGEGKVLEGGPGRATGAQEDLRAMDGTLQGGLQGSEDDRIATLREIQGLKGSSGLGQ